MIQKICEGITSFVKQNAPDITEEKEEILNYGLQIFIYEIFMLILVFSLGYILKIFEYITAAVISYSLIRGLANGAHARTRTQCSSSYFLIMFGLIYLCKYILTVYNLYFVSAIMFINIIILYMCAPGDTEENPNNIEKRKKIQKYLSICAIIVLYITAYINSFTNPQISNVIVLESTFGVFLTTPMAYKMLGCKRSFKV